MIRIEIGDGCIGFWAMKDAIVWSKKEQMNAHFELNICATRERPLSVVHNPFPLARLHSICRRSLNPPGLDWTSPTRHEDLPTCTNRARKKKTKKRTGYGSSLELFCRNYVERKRSPGRLNRVKLVAGCRPPVLPQYYYAE